MQNFSQELKGEDVVYQNVNLKLTTERKNFFPAHKLSSSGHQMGIFFLHT